MSMKRNINTKWTLGATPTILQLESGEGAEILALRAYHSTAQYAEMSHLTIDQRICLSLGLGAVRHVPQSLYSDVWPDIYEMTRERFPEVPAFKIPDGKKAIIEGADANGGTALIYRVLQGDQVPAPDAPGAPKSNSMFRVLYGCNKDVLTTDRWYKIDESIAHQVLEKAPFEDNEAMMFDFRIYAIVGAALSAMGSYSKKLRMFVDDTEILSDDQEGVPYPGQPMSPFAYFSTAFAPHIAWLKHPIDILKGQRVRMEHFFDHDGVNNLPARRTYIALAGWMNPAAPT